MHDPGFPPRQSLLHRPPVRLGVLVACGALAVLLLWPRGQGFSPVDAVPAQSGGGRVELRSGQLVLHLQGSPEQLGDQHGRLLQASIRLVVQGYLHESVCGGRRPVLDRLLVRARVLKPALPAWYLRELRACAAAAGVAEDELLAAQCEGDLASVREAPATAARPGHPPQACSAYVVFGDPRLSGGQLRAGRNFDYAAGDFVHHCALATYVRPPTGAGHRFLAVGWSGILGGWTLVNDRGLVVANHVGGGSATNPRGVPTLIMARILAQRAGTIDEALALLRGLPRMRGQIIWLAQPADPAAGRPARAVAAEYDAAAVFVRESHNGLLTVSNRNVVFGGKAPPEDLAAVDSVCADLQRALEVYPRGPVPVITATARPSTLHAVEVDFGERCVRIAHGRRPAQDGPFVPYPLP